MSPLILALMGFRPAAGLLPGVFDSRKPAELHEIGARVSSRFVGRRPIVTERKLCPTSSKPESMRY
jgi:hypothetical protein